MASSAGDAQRYRDVRRIVVVRPGAIGDFVFALPALAALRASYPEATLTLAGRAWQTAFLAGRGVVDEAVTLPAIRGVGAPATALENPAEVARALKRLAGADLAIQLYGGGAYSNPFTRRLRARHTVGMQAPGAPPLDRTLPYVYLQNERLRLLEVAGLAGAAPADLDPRLPTLARDEIEAAACLGNDDGRPWVVVQPGATDGGRRWPPARFAAVADALAAAGGRIAVNGSATERELVDSVRGAMRHPALDLAAHGLSVSGLAGVLARAALVVSNDTGPLHLAQALGTPTVGIYWFTNLLISAPLVAARHRHAVALDVACPLCGIDNARRRCTHHVSLVTGVGVDAVRDQALALLAETRSSRSSASARTSAARTPSGSHTAR